MSLVYVHEMERLGIDSCFMNVVHEGVVSMLGFVVFVFHELVKNLMRKVRVLVGLCIDQ